MNATIFHVRPAAAVDLSSGHHSGYIIEDDAGHEVGDVHVIGGRWYGQLGYRNEEYATAPSTTALDALMTIITYAYNDFYPNDMPTVKFVRR